VAPLTLAAERSLMLSWKNVGKSMDLLYPKKINYTTTISIWTSPSGKAGSKPFPLTKLIQEFPTLKLSCPLMTQFAWNSWWELLWATTSMCSCLDQLELVNQCTSNNSAHMACPKSS
jgi:hypothetical protein